MKNIKARRPRSRRKRRSPRIFLGVALTLFVCTGSAVFFARQRQDTWQNDHPQLDHYLVDPVGFLAPADANQLRQTLDQLREEDGPRLAVVLRPSLTAATIADEALAFARKYQVGRAGKDDGVVLLIVEREKQARIEVGYGLEGILTDALSRIVIDRDIEPYLQQGDVSSAAFHGTAAILRIIHPAAFVQAAPKPLGVGWYAGVALFMFVVLLVLVGFIQALILANASMRARMARSPTWRWFAAIHILGGGGRDRDDNRSSNGGSSGTGGSFGGGGAND
jgi:uncharacterized protein